jgi:hypothetical protein
MGHAVMNWERQSSVKSFKSFTCFLDGLDTFNVATDGSSSLSSRAAQEATV